MEWDWLKLLAPSILNCYKPITELLPFQNYTIFYSFMMKETRIVRKKSSMWIMWKLCMNSVFNSSILYSSLPLWLTVHRVMDRPLQKESKSDWKSRNKAAMPLKEFMNIWITYPRRSLFISKSPTSSLLASLFQIITIKPPLFITLESI